MAGMDGLENLRERLALGRDAVPLGGLPRIGRVVAQRLPEPAHAVVALARAEQDRHHRAVREVLVELRVDFLAGRRDILEDLLEQRVVVVGKHFEHRRQRLLLAIGDRGRKGDELGGLSLAVTIGALTRKIDIAGDGLALADRHLAQHERALRVGLQRRNGVAHAAGEGVDLVDEQEVRDRLALQVAQQRREHHRLLRRRLADDDREVGDAETGAGLVHELDRAGAVEQRPGIAHEAAMPEPDVGAHGSRLGVASCGPAGSGEQRLEQRRFPAAIGPDQRDGARAGPISL